MYSSRDFHFQGYVPTGILHTKKVGAISDPIRKGPLGGFKTARRVEC